MNTYMINILHFNHEQNCIFRNDDSINQKESDFCASVFSCSDRPHNKLSFLRHFSSDSGKKKKKIGTLVNQHVLFLSEKAVVDHFQLNYCM